MCCGCGIVYCGCGIVERLRRDAQIHPARLRALRGACAWGMAHAHALAAHVKCDRDRAHSGSAGAEAHRHRDSSLAPQAPRQRTYEKTAMGHRGWVGHPHPRMGDPPWVTAHRRRHESPAPPAGLMAHSAPRPFASSRARPALGPLRAWPRGYRARWGAATPPRLPEWSPCWNPCRSQARTVRRRRACSSRPASGIGRRPVGSARGGTRAAAT